MVASGEAVEDGGAGDRAFYFDLSSPECWLAAEQVMAVVPQPCEWIPVSMPFEPAFRCAAEEDAFREDIVRAAAESGLQPVVWPAEMPFDADFANRAATYLKGGGKVVGFALAALRQAFCGGRSLAEVEHVMIAAAAVETHPRALLIGTETASVRRRLAEATALARERGVESVPALWTGSAVVHGRLDAPAV